MSGQSLGAAAVAAAEALWLDVERCRVQSRAERIDRYRADPLAALAPLVGPPPYRHVECSGEARRHVRALVALSANRHPAVVRDVAPESLRRAVEYHFVGSFVRQSLPRTLGHVCRSVDAACRWLRTKIGPHTVALPCIMWSDREPASVNWGPVMFLRTADFLREYPAEAPAVTDHEWPADVREFAERAGWVAVVRIPSADGPTAVRRAELALERAIALLQACVGPSRARELRPAARQTTTRTGYWWVDATGTRFPSLSLNWPGVAMGHEGWPDRVRSHYGVRLRAAESLLGETVDPAASTPHGQRYLEALGWFGDGVADANLAARVVKHVMAWERLVVKRSTRTSNIAERVCMTLAQWLSPEFADARALQGRLRKLYDWRSRLVHGDCSSTVDQRLASAARDCEMFTAKILLAAAPDFAPAVADGGASG